MMANQEEFTKLIKGLRKTLITITEQPKWNASLGSAYAMTLVEKSKSVQSYLKLPLGKPDLARDLEMKTQELCEKLRQASDTATISHQAAKFQSITLANILKILGIDPARTASF